MGNTSTIERLEAALLTRLRAEVTEIAITLHHAENWTLAELARPEDFRTLKTDMTLELAPGIAPELARPGDFTLRQRPVGGSLTIEILTSEEAAKEGHEDLRPLFRPGQWPKGLTSPLTVDEALQLVREALPGMVAEVAAEVAEVARLLVAAERRPAVLARPEVANKWPLFPAYALQPKPDKGPAWFALYLLSRSITDLFQSDANWPGTVAPLNTFWPGTVAPLSVVEWVAEIANKPPNPPQWASGLRNLVDTRGPYIVPWWLTAEVNGRQFGVPGVGLALLYAADRAVEQSQRTPMVRVGATKPARAVIAALSTGPFTRDEGPAPWANAELYRDEGRVELMWNGRPSPLQLSLRLDNGEALGREVIRGILAELQTDGVRDWLVLHRIAQEQGCTGTLRWTWAEHRERTAYADRIRNKNATEAELQSAVVSRLWRKANATLRLWAERDGKRGWVRVGPFGLLDIPAGVEVLTAAGSCLDVAKVVINPALYEGAKAGDERPHFALVPDEVLRLPGEHVRLAVELVYGWQDKRSPSGIVRLAETLWQWAGIAESQYTQRKRWPEVIRTLESMLDMLGRTMGMDWNREGEPGPKASYTLRPPQAWVDRALHHAPPILVSKAAVPRTGAELKAWREARGLSQRDLAALCGLSQSKLARAERDLALPEATVEALAKAM